MTETVFSQSLEASSTELCLQCPCMLSNILRLFSRLFWKKRRRFLLPQERVRRLFFCTNGITPFMEVFIITPRPRTLFRTKSPWFHLSNGATPAGRGWYRRRDLVGLGRIVRGPIPKSRSEKAVWSHEREQRFLYINVKIRPSLVRLRRSY